MKIKSLIIFLFIFVVLTAAMGAVEIGFIAGTLNNPGGFSYGLSSGGGFIVSLIRFEIEIYKITNSDYKGISGSMKVRPKFGKFAPYAVLGFGTDYATFNFKFDQYRSFTFIGGGLHLFLGDMLSFRFDLRFLNYTDINKTRLSAGIFIHL